jgi:uncharacterized protein
MVDVHLMMSSSLRWTIIFFLLSFALTWATGISVVLSDQNALVNGPVEPQVFTLPFSLAVSLILIGDYAPALIAVLVAFIMARGKAVGDLLRQVIRWRFNPLLYPLAFFLTLSIQLLTVAMLVFGFGMSTMGPVFSMPNFIRIGGLFIGPLGEELGFRGFAQPLLQKRYSFLTSSLVVGGLWFVWQQWPLFAPAGLQGLDLIALVTTLVYLLAASIFFGWLYNVARGSVLVVCVAHAGLDFQKSIAPDLLSSHLAQALSTILLGIVAIGIVSLWQRKGSNIVSETLDTPV